MALPDLIEIVPLDKPVRAEITVPGSKSITNRSLILAALADGEVTLEGALWSEDTQIMVWCLQELGFMVNVAPDPNEICNRTITVYGQGGKVPGGGTPTHLSGLELFVGNAGTAARFLAAFVCLGKGVYRLHGVSRMHERPQAALFQALRELGYRVDAPNDKLPAVIYGRDAFHSVPDSKKENGNAVERVPTSRCTVSIEESSQFASALLLCAKHGGWKVEVVGENAEESPYVAMTTKMIEAFPHHGGKFRIEPDASSGSYFWATGWLFNTQTENNISAPVNISLYDLMLFLQKRTDSPKFFSVRVLGWPDSNWQIDQKFPKVVPAPPQFPGIVSRATDLGDSIMTAIVIAPFALSKSQFSDLGRLRVQETERVVALQTELKKCGVRVEEDKAHDTLTIYPAQMEELHGAEIETYNDHRMAMCFAILGLKVPGIKIKNPACVKKTFPNFFQKMAAPPPKGLGATIWEIKNGQRTRKLSGEDLFAD
jgi:3-phosphoshikimate 1-carboxyvinyltransferase